MLYTVSSRRDETRRTLLNAAQELFEERGAHAVKLEDIARRAGVSRQAVYLHFGSRAGLLLELVAHVDDTGPLSRLAERVTHAQTGTEALNALVALAADYWPVIYRIARPFDEHRRADAAIAHAWDDRMERRREGCRGIVQRLADADELNACWTVSDATDILWAMTSMRTWEDLVIDSDWSADRYHKSLTKAVHKALLA
jgi:AcrR family transcriptional regulator